MQGDEERRELKSRIKESVAQQNAVSGVRLVRELMAGSKRPSDAAFCATALGKLSAEMIAQGANFLRTYIVRSVTVEPILAHLTLAAAKSNYVLKVKVGGYGSYAEEILNPDSELARFRPDAVLVLLDLEDIAGHLPDLCADGFGARVDAAIEESISSVAQLLRGYRAGSTARILLQGVVVPEATSLGDVGDANLRCSLPNAVLNLNERLAALCRSIPDCVFFDVDRLAARHGRRRWRDTKMFLASRLQVSPEAFGSYADGLIRSLSPLFRAPRKVLCTDLDNTLWGGVLGEDGVNGIATGSAFPGNGYYGYQRYLKQLSARGILLAMVSKNNEAEVREAFETRAADMAVGWGDFIAVKVGWGDKSDAIRELAHELSLGLDSFVFVDDNPVECEAIRQRLPEVAVVVAPEQEPWRLVEILVDEAFFDAATITEDDRNRHGDYRAQTQRSELEVLTGGRDEFLASLGIVCTFGSALYAPLARSVQLLAKTNQFNLTTRRYSAAEVEDFASTVGGQAIAVRVRDRFGDAGVVGLALAKTEGDNCRIDSLLLSCRVIGRGIETALLAQVAARAIQDGALRLVGEYVASSKNTPCKDFFTKHGFTPIASPKGSSMGSEFYEFDLTAAVPTSPEWITLEGNEVHHHAVFTR